MFATSFKLLYQFFSLFEGKLCGLKRVLGFAKFIKYKSLEFMRAPMLTLLIPQNTSRFNFVQLQHMTGAWIGTEHLSSDIITLYIHGGGFISGNIHAFLNISEKLSDELQCPVFIPQYSVLPENTFNELYHEILLAISHITYKYPNRKLCLFGDSAGGGIICYCVDRLLKDPSLEIQVYKCVLFSPMVDIHTTPNIDNDVYISKYNLMICKKFIRQCQDVHTYETSQYVFDKFPPVYVSVSDNEILLSDSLWLYDKLKNVQLQIYSNCFHSFVLFWSLVPEFGVEFINIRNFLSVR